MADDPRKDIDDQDGDEPSKKPVAEADEAEDGLPEPKNALARRELDDASDAPDSRDASDSPAESPADEDEEDDVLPGQMGHRRYVYAAFFTFAICIAYFFSKAGLAIWHRLSQWTPKVGEPREDMMTPIAAAIAGVVVFIVYRRAAVRTLADEVALELSKVEWPTKENVRKSTTIVVSACLLSSLAFWLYDIGANRAIGFITESSKTWVVLLRVGVGAVAIYVVRALGIRFLLGTGRA